MREYFRSANQFNVVTNTLSGNVFPLGQKDGNLSFASLLWVMFVWAIKITYFLTMMSGTLYFANLTAVEAIKRSGPAAAVSFELIIPTVYLNLRRMDLRDLIRKYNDILIDSEELRKLVQDTIRPYKKGLKFYIGACLVAVSAWSATPVLVMTGNNQFTYANYAAPAYFPGEPFGKKTFVGGIVLQVVGSSFITFGKISIDIYISQFVTVLSAQYKYVRAQIAKALASQNGQKDELSVIRALQNCIRHHCAVIEISQGLAELLALQIGATYVICILKFCFLAFGVITFESAIIEKGAYLMYALACVLHIFLLCSCIQELLDVSTSVTQDAFHENWHGRSSSVKQLFYTIEMSNQMGCRLSAYRIVDLVVPTMGVILSKSYSVCLLLLKMN